MDKCRPIEAGCLAMIVNMPERKREYNWTPVTVLKFSPACLGVNRGDQDLWVVSLPCERSISGFWGIEEKYLTRIDDPSIQSQIENEQETVNCG